MAGTLLCLRPVSVPINFKTHHGAWCCSGEPNIDTTPAFVNFAVNGITEILRLFSSFQANRIDAITYKKSDDVSVSSTDDVLNILKSDYADAYFVTGNFSFAIYAEDCIFEDPTIKFQGTELYSRNLKLLVPFFDCPSIGLQKIEKGVDSETCSVVAKWKLRTYLKLPWRPLISIDGSTMYKLGNEFKIVRHTENWNISALQAIGQIFTPTVSMLPGK